MVLQEQFGLERPLEMLTNRAPDIMFVGLALLLPFATISFGLGEWKSGSETGGLMAALIATLFLFFALIAAIWPEAVQGAEWSSLLKPTFPRCPLERARMIAEARLVRASGRLPQTSRARSWNG